VETPQEEESRDFVSDHDSDHYPEDYAGEEEDDEEDDDHEEEEEEEKVVGNPHIRGEGPELG
jgi:hypothetical protein